MTIKHTYIILAATLVALTACVDDYSVDSNYTGRQNDTYDIEGCIAPNGESLCYIYHASGPDNVSRYPVENAKVWVESDAGFQSEAATYDSSRQVYVLNTTGLNTLHKYRLVVKCDGETFESDYRQLVTPGVFDAVQYVENKQEQTIDIVVDAHGKEGDTPHYMWTIEEDYETLSHFSLSEEKIGEWISVSWNGKNYSGYLARYCPELESYVVFAVNNSDRWAQMRDNPGYYRHCWNSTTTGNINLMSTTEMQTNTVQGHTIHRIPQSSVKISYLYAATVHQWGMTAEDMLYYSELQKTTEETGGLFSPTPSRLHGNIHCVSNPAIKTMGYILGTDTQMQRVFISSDDLKEVPCTYKLQFGVTDPRQGDVDIRDAMEGNKMVAWFPEIDGVMPYHVGTADLLYSEICFSCIKAGGTKNKPSWWPNDHK